MQKPEVARTPEAFGQPMLQHQPEELRARHGAMFTLARLRIAIAERHLSVLDLSFERIAYGVRSTSRLEYPLASTPWWPVLLFHP